MQFRAGVGIVFRIVLITIFGVVANAKGASVTNLDQDDHLELQESIVLLDTSRDIPTMWEIDSHPYRQFLPYYNMSNDINNTIINSTDFDLEPFYGTDGVWVFPYKLQFGELLFAYFRSTRIWNSIQTIEIIGYLHKNAELRIYNVNGATEPNIVFQSSNITGWETFVVDMVGSYTFRAEIHVNETGGFGFIDKILGHWSVPTVPPRPTPPSSGTEAPTTGLPSTTTSLPCSTRGTGSPDVSTTPIPEQTTDPICPTAKPTTTTASTLRTTTIRDGDDDGNCPVPTCNCTCNCNCEGIPLPSPATKLAPIQAFLGTLVISLLIASFTMSVQ